MRKPTLWLALVLIVLALPRFAAAQQLRDGDVSARRRVWVEASTTLLLSSAVVGASWAVFDGVTRRCEARETQGLLAGAFCGLDGIVLRHHVDCARVESRAQVAHRT